MYSSRQLTLAGVKIKASAVYTATFTLQSPHVGVGWQLQGRVLCAGAILKTRLEGRPGAVTGTGWELRSTWSHTWAPVTSGFQPVQPVGGTDTPYADRRTEAGLLSCSHAATAQQGLACQCRGCFHGSSLHQVSALLFPPRLGAGATTAPACLPPGCFPIACGCLSLARFSARGPFLESFHLNL